VSVARVEVLRDLLTDGGHHRAEALCEVAVGLGLPASDVFVVANRPVPAHLLPDDGGDVRGRLARSASSRRGVRERRLCGAPGGSLRFGVPHGTHVLGAPNDDRSTRAAGRAPAGHP
jgi:hypothetical protein